MGQIINISHAYPSASRGKTATAEVTRPRPTPVAPEGEDIVDLSDTALSRAVELSSLKLAKAAAIRGELENGTYETKERINYTVECLLDVLG